MPDHADLSPVASTLRWINASPSPFHAVAIMAHILHRHGFVELSEMDSWRLEPGGRYFVIRGAASIIAFVTPLDHRHPPAVRMVGAHTDSPGLKLKPNPLKKKGNHWVADVEVYGGPLLSTWMDRDLSLAGMVGYIGPDGQSRQLLVDWREAVALVPNLAIHLNRTANDDYKIQRHEELSPIFMPLDAEQEEAQGRDLFLAELTKALVRNHPQMTLEGFTALDWDLFFYDTQPVARIGPEGSWVSGARLDNLISCFSGLRALLAILDEENRPEQALPMLACFHHEEVGSHSTTGAAGNFTEAVMGRLLPEPESMARSMARSRMLSVDNAHAVHPNFISKHDGNNAPEINKGVVIKSNANQRYTTHVISSSHLKALCRRLDLPVQDFTMRSDMPCGSTIGPMLSARLGLQSIDIGVPTWAMHSIRESAGALDIIGLDRLLAGFFSEPMEA
ncbi:MAG: M18 family aminopeptidase [Magnetococcales bacterium]|nr:M18 family aminopeptidase [Magnetococcales bacterium]